MIECRVDFDLFFFWMKNMYHLLYSNVKAG